MINRRKFFKSAAVSALTASAIPANAGKSFSGELISGIKFPSENSAKYWKKIRKMFPMPENEAYFNAGTIGPMPIAVIESIIKDLQDGSKYISNPEKAPKILGGYDGEDVIRQKIAGIINANMKDIALTRNSTMGMNFIAGGLELKPGDEVVMTDQEHAGGRCGWELAAKRRGIVIKFVKMDIPSNDESAIVERFVKEITPKTRVFAFSHLISIWSTMLPIKDICGEAKKRGIISVVDGAQGVGQVPVDVKDIGCDVYFSSLHKWILAPAGSGMIYINKNIAPDVWSIVAGHMWDGHEDEGYRLTARGTENAALFSGLNTALDFHLKIGNKRVTDRILYLSEYFRNELKKIDKIEFKSPTVKGLCAGMTTFNIKGLKGGYLQNELWRRGNIMPTAKGDEIGIRVSTHIYNSIEEINRLLEILKELSREA